jgi:hypothetical protein
MSTPITADKTKPGSVFVPIVTGRARFCVPTIHALSAAIGAASALIGGSKDSRPHHSPISK